MSETEPVTLELISMPAVAKAALKEVRRSRGRKRIFPCQEGGGCLELNINNFCAANKCAYSALDKALVCHLRGGVVRMVALPRQAVR